MITATYIDHMGSDLSVVNAARVSFGKKSHCEETRWVDMGDWCGDMPVVDDKDTKLIHYLAKHGHYSPFGHCFASFHIKAPIFVARQLVKHEYLRMNEISRRYVDDDPELYKPSVWRGKSKDKKQGSYGDVTDFAMNFIWHDGYRLGDELEFHDKAVVALYRRMISIGIAPEMARMVLPQSMYTEWYWSGSMDAFANMCNLRLKEDTQYETRLVAQQIDEMMQGLYPISWKALVKGEAND
jgi:thymidylate synthase (FAD)